MRKKVELPKGFTAITRGGDSWKGEKPGDTLQGVLIGSKTVSMPARGRQPARDVELYSIETEDGTKRDVFESAGLRALADVKKGTPVCIVYVGLKSVGKGKNPMRDYLVGTGTATGRRRAKR